MKITRHLAPFWKVDTEKFESASSHRVHHSLPAELARQFPEIVKVLLPTSRRLLQNMVELIQPSLYPSLPFNSVVNNSDRQLEFVSPGTGSPIDQVLDKIASGVSIVGLELPARNFIGGDVDQELSCMKGQLVARILERGATWAGKRKLTPADIGCIDSHVASGFETRRQLLSKGISTNEIVVNTPEIWQGGEKPVMIVKHPLSGLLTPDSFSLNKGRWCVSLPRHLIGYIVVARKGIFQALQNYDLTSSNRPLGGVDEQ